MEYLLAFLWVPAGVLTWIVCEVLLARKRRRVMLAIVECRTVHDEIRRLVAPPLRASSDK